MKTFSVVNSDVVSHRVKPRLPVDLYPDVGTQWTLVHGRAKGGSGAGGGSERSSTHSGEEFLVPAQLPHGFVPTTLLYGCRRFSSVDLFLFSTVFYSGVSLNVGQTVSMTSRSAAQ